MKEEWKERPLKKKVTDSCFQTHTSSLWQLSFPSFIGSFFSRIPLFIFVILFADPGGGN